MGLYDLWSRRLVATRHQAIAATDDVLDGMDRAIRDAWQGLAYRLVRIARAAPPARRRAAIEAALKRAMHRLLTALGDALVSGRAIAAEALAQSIPAGLLAELAGRLLVGARSPLTEASDPIVLSVDLPDAPATIRPSAMSPDQARAAIAATILPPLDRDTLIRTWVGLPRQTVAATLERRLSDRLWSPAAKAAIEAALTDGIARGETVDRLAQRIRTVVSAQTWQARRIARTEARRALERDHLARSVEALGDMVEGIMIQAVMDDRTRPEHAARHGTIYYRQPDGRYRDRRGNPAPELPDAPNCRCSYVPVLREPDLSEPARRAYETATRRLIPDLPTYQEVWDKADVRTRRRMIGAKRYDVAMQRFGGVDPWMVMDEDGSLRPIRLLQQESIDDAYERRAAVLTAATLVGPRMRIDATGSAIGTGVARRVMARIDLPSIASDAQAVEYILSQTPPVSRGYEVLSPAKTVEAIRAACDAWAQAAAASPRVTRDALREAVWRLIRRDRPARPMTFIEDKPLPDDLRQRLQLAIEWVRWLVPDRELPPFRVVTASRAGYSRRSDTIAIESWAGVDRIVHELMHRVDAEYTSYRFGAAYARRLTSAVINANGEVYQIARDNKPGLYPYQRRRYDRSPPALEFIATMAEQLARNPVMAAYGDPEGLELWIRQMRRLR